MSPEFCTLRRQKILGLLPNLPGYIVQHNLGKYHCIGFIRQVRAEADADIKDPVR